MKRPIDETKPTSLNLNDKEVSQNQEIQEPLLKKPKEEPLDFFYQQFLGKSTVTSATPQLPWQNDAENILFARFQDKGCSSQLTKNCLALSSGGILNSDVGSATLAVKQEPVDIYLPILDFGNVKDRRVNGNCMYLFLFQFKVV